MGISPKGTVESMECKGRTSGNSEVGDTRDEIEKDDNIMDDD